MTGRRRTRHRALQHRPPRIQQPSATPHRRTPQETAHHTGTHQSTGRQRRRGPNEQHDQTITAQHSTAQRGDGKGRTAQYPRTHTACRAQSADQHGETQRRRAKHPRMPDRAGGHDRAGSGTQQRETTAQHTATQTQGRAASHDANDVTRQRNQSRGASLSLWFHSISAQHLRVVYKA